MRKKFINVADGFQVKIKLKKDALRLSQCNEEYLNFFRGELKNKSLTNPQIGRGLFYSTIFYIFCVVTSICIVPSALILALVWWSGLYSSEVLFFF